MEAQPIDTAPKDGTVVLFYDCGWWIGSFHRGDWLDQYGERLYPTHWAPLPVEPVDRSKETPHRVISNHHDVLNDQLHAAKGGLR